MNAQITSKAAAGRRIVITRARPGAARFATMLRELGADIIEFPTIELAPPDDGYSVLDRALGRLDSFDWVIFTSANGVDAVLARMRLCGIGFSALARRRIAAIGPATAKRLETAGFRVAALPREYRAEEIVPAIGMEAISGARFLIPRAQVAREVLPAILRERGAAEVLVAPAYRTVTPSTDDANAMAQWLTEGTIDLVTFTSSSTVDNFVALVRKIPHGMRAAVIGPITADTARRHGFEVVVCPKDYTIPALAQAIADYFADRSG
jgi:uroporphyrinogen III methyltransferase/synthase